MAQYDNTNTFTLFVNDKGENQKRPDWTGNMNVDGIEFRLSGWIRESAKGKFVSGCTSEMCLRYEYVIVFSRVPWVHSGVTHYAL